MRKTHGEHLIENLLSAGLFVYVVVVCIIAVFGPPSIPTRGVAFDTFVRAASEQAQPVQVAKPVVRPRKVPNVVLETNPTRDVSHLMVARTCGWVPVADTRASCVA